MSRLRDKVCVITGASSGIGAASAHRFREEDGTVVGLDLNENSEVDLSLRIDVTNEDAVAGAYRTVYERYGHIDVLFNNAGISPPTDGSVLEADADVWQTVQNVNVKGVYHCCKHGIPYLLEAGRGSVINTASFVAVLGSAVSQAAYTASKGAVLALSRELAVQFIRDGVRVNALCPGPVRTPMLDEIYASDPAAAARRLQHLPAGRLADAREIADAALFLASDESSYVNGTTFLVDGGAAAAYLPADRAPRSVSGPASSGS